MTATPLDLTTWHPPELTRATDALTAPVDARGADWRDVTLRNVDLRDANLCRTDLRGADFSSCDLSGADLRLARYDHKTQVPEGFDLRSSGAVGPGARLSGCLLYTSPSPRDLSTSRMPSSA